LTKYAISGLVIVSYCKERTTYLSREVSWNCYEPCLDSLQLDIMGVLMELHSSILVLERRSLMYLL